jgi:hypothetical protein
MMLSSAIIIGSIKQHGPFLISCCFNYITKIQSVQKKKFLEDISCSTRYTYEVATSYRYLEKQSISSSISIPLSLSILKVLHRREFVSFMTENY